eukprot:CAMPEP_0185847748 /NCGR_PEP_ID=MMETSP1354-20130828/2900_1 /TAXON_ID=708628 /ORGANISM="Erythrolobus madagascarensis, Strain CCMP3276" /LENGTH=438 /DNA_ID=CAMNT_0028548077 /DNA_START=133 /DNA_END=1449 /DNA_ORIENTATION=+
MTSDTSSPSSIITSNPISRKTSVCTPKSALESRASSSHTPDALYTPRSSFLGKHTPDTGTPRSALGRNNDPGTPRSILSKATFRREDRASFRKEDRGSFRRDDKSVTRTSSGGSGGGGGAGRATPPQPQNHHQNPLARNPRKERRGTGYTYAAVRRKEDSRAGAAGGGGPQEQAVSATPYRILSRYDSEATSVGGMSRCASGRMALMQRQLMPADANSQVPENGSLMELLDQCDVQTVGLKVSDIKMHELRNELARRCVTHLAVVLVGDVKRKEQNVIEHYKETVRRVREQLKHDNFHVLLVFSSPGTSVRSFCNMNKMKLRTFGDDSPVVLGTNAPITAVGDASRNIYMYITSYHNMISSNRANSAGSSGSLTPKSGSSSGGSDTFLHLESVPSTPKRADAFAPSSLGLSRQYLCYVVLDLEDDAIERFGVDMSVSF